MFKYRSKLEDTIKYRELENQGYPIHSQIDLMTKNFKNLEFRLIPNKDYIGFTLQYSVKHGVHGWEDIKNIGYLPSTIDPLLFKTEQEARDYHSCLVNYLNDIVNNRLKQKRLLSEFHNKYSGPIYL